MFYLGNKQFRSNTVFRACQESGYTVLHAIRDIERLFHGVHHDPVALVQEYVGKNSRYVVTTDRDIRLQLNLVLCAGRKEAEASPYTSIAAMLIESSALYATWSLVFIIVYAVGSPGQYVLLMTLCNVQVYHCFLPCTMEGLDADILNRQVIAPILIVYRVSKGVGWEQGTTAVVLTTTRMLFSGNQGRSDTMLDARNSGHYEPSGSSLKMEFASDPSPAESKASSSNGA